MNSYYVNKNLELEEGVVAFSLGTLVDYFKPEDYVDLLNKVDTYVVNNRKKLNQYKVPQHYMEAIDVDDIDLIKTNDIEVIKDVDLTICVMLKTVGTLYIPIKVISEKNISKSLKEKLVFLKGEYIER